MSNVLKGGLASIEDEKKVINSNAMVADRLKLLKTIMEREQSAGSDDLSPDGFTEGLDAEMLEGILNDPDSESGEAGSGNVMKAAPPEPAIDMEAIQAEADQIIEDAKAQADQIIQEAMDQAEAGKAQIYEEARNAGHEEGYGQGLAEAETIKAELAMKEQEMMAQYEQMVSELEPALIDMLSDIYGHIFNTDLKDKKEIILYLLQNALQNTDTTVDIMIHVSKDDYDFISSNKEALFEGIPGADNTEIVPDVTLSQGQAMIDTGSGIFDCSLGTELEGLKKQLMVLAYRREE